MDEAQSCGSRPPGEEEGYDADSESNPGDMAKQEGGRSPQNNLSPYACSLPFQEPAHLVIACSVSGVPWVHASIRLSPPRSVGNAAD